MVNIFHWQQCKLYVPVFGINYIPNISHCFYTLHTNAAGKQKNVHRPVKCTVWLNRYKRHTSCCLVFHFLLNVSVNYFTRSEGINHLWSNGYKMLQVCVWDSVMCVFVNAGKPHLRLFQAWGQSELLWRTRTPMTCHQIMGHKGPVLRPRCIGTKRLQAQLLLYTLCHCHLTAQQ